MERSSGSRLRTTQGRLVGVLLEAGTSAGEITRFLSTAQDALYARAARDGEAALGPPPCPYALLVLGSGARRETTLRTDQDHALVLADDPPPGAGDWFSALAEQLAITLERGGLPRCPGDVMATNPAWRVPLRAWQELFAGWIQRPEEDALLYAATFFDLRQVHGDLDVEERLRRVIHRAAGSRQFLGRLAAAALRGRPSPGFPGHLRGEHRGRVDLKAHGIAPIVDLVRLFALEAGSHATATVARLRAAAEHGTAGRATGADLAAAFEYLQQLRLGHQTSRLAAGAPPDDVIALAELTMLQRRWIKDALHLVHTCQESVRIAYRVDLIA